MKKARRVANASPASCSRRGFRGGLALTRLSALIALGFMPGLPAMGASFSDQVTFSTSGQSLWGNAVATDFLGLRSPLGVKWGTYAGNAASQHFSFDGITSLTDPVFGASLGKYGVASSFSSSGTLGLDISSYLRGGTLGYTQTLNPLLSLPDSYTANTRFTVSAVDSLGSTPKLSATMPVINLYVDAKLKFDASLSATGCFISCTSTTQNFSIGPGPIQVLSWDSQRSPAATVAGQGIPSLVAGSTSSIALARPGGGTTAVGSLKVVDSFPNGCDSAGVGAVHCGNNVLSAQVDLSALASLSGAPVDVDRSFAGINFKSRLLDVTLSSDLWVDLDLKVDAPVFTRLVFDKPVTEFLANGQSVLHSDGVVSFAMGSSVSLAFGSQVGTLVKRTYYLDDPGFSAAIATVASLKLDSKVGCGFSLTAFGRNVVPDTTGNCLTTDSTTLSTGKDTVYNGSSNLNTVRTAATYQGLGSTNLLNLTGVYGPGNPVTNAGAGSLASVAVGQLATISGVGARWTNTRAAQTSIAGTLRLEAGGLLDNSEGAELLIERGAILTTAGFDAAYALSELRNSKSVTAGGAPAVINNFGSIHANGRVTNSGTINNHGDFTLNAAILSFNGGVFNNGAGGRLIIGDDLYTLTLGSAAAGTINLLPDSRLIVNGSFSVAPGYKQINEGEISVAPTATNAGFSIYGELQFGNGSVHGSMAQGELKTYYSTGTNGTIGGVVSFHRSDNTSFSSLISGSGSVVKRGVNTLTFTANQTYTGPTTVESGRLTLAGQTRSSDIRIRAGAQLEMQAPTDRDNTTDTRFTGQGTLVKTGGGTMLWGASRAVFALDAGARIDVLGGTFVAGSSANDDWSQNKASLFVASGATFWGAENNVRMDALTGSGRIHSGFKDAGYEAFRFGVAGGSGSFSGVLADTDAANRHIGSFIKEGSGTQVLAGNNTFTGGLAILEGQVQIGDGGTSGSLAARQIVNQAELSFSRSDDSRFDGTIVGTGNLTKLGAGQLTLTQSQPTLSPGYSGLTSVRGGTLVLTNINNSRGHDISQGAVLELQVASGTRDGTVDAQFGGQGTLRKTGAGMSVWTARATTFAMGAGSLIDVQAGSFVGGSFGNEDWRLNQSALNVAAGASFSGVEANVRVDGLSGAGRISSGFAGAGYTAFTIGVAGGSGDFSGVLADSGAGNAGRFVKVGSGTQTLRGASTFTGGLDIEGGALALAGGSNRLPTGITVNIRNGASLDLGGTAQTLTGLGTQGSRVVGNLGAGSLFTSNGVFLQSGRVDATLQGGGSLSHQRLWIGGDAGATVTLNGSNDMVYSADHNQVLIGHGTTGAAGTVRVGNARALAAATEGVQVFAGTLDLNGVTAVRARDIALLGGTASALVNDHATRGASFLQGVILGSAARSRVGGAGDLALGGAISGQGGIQKIGAGSLLLSGTNSYTGGTTLAGGVLSVAREANLGGAGSGIIFAGGTLRNTGAFITARQVELDFHGGVFDTANGFLTINGAVSGAGGLTKTGGDILTLGGGKSYSGATVVSAGTLKFAANGTTATNVASPSIAVSNGARVLFEGNQTYAGAINGAGRLTHEFGGTTTLTGNALHTGGTVISGGTLQVGNGGTRGALVGAVVNDGLLAFNRSDDTAFGGPISGSGGVAQRGSGTLTLSGDHSHRGATTVEAGTLRLNGRALQSAFSVAPGATLGGQAAIGALHVAGTLAPGQSPGQISAGASTFASGGRYLWELNDGTGPAGIGYDLLNVAGTLSVDATAGSRFTISLVSLLGDNRPGNASHFDARSDHRYTLARTSGGILGFSADEFAIDSSGFGNATFGGQWAVGVSGQDLTLNFTAAVPEPETYAMLLAGLLAVGAVARRRRPGGTAEHG